MIRKNEKIQNMQLELKEKEVLIKEQNMLLEKQEQIINQMSTILNRNHYGRVDIVLNRVRELIHDFKEEQIKMKIKKTCTLK